MEYHLSCKILPNFTSMFHRFKLWAFGHNATNFTKWYPATEPYEIKWARGFEPYLVVRKEGLPLFYEHFVGYGYNKELFYMSLHQKSS